MKGARCEKNSDASLVDVCEWLIVFIAGSTIWPSTAAAGCNLPTTIVPSRAAAWSKMRRATVVYRQFPEIISNDGFWYVDTASSMASASPPPPYLSPMVPSSCAASDRPPAFRLPPGTLSNASDVAPSRPSSAPSSTSSSSSLLSLSVSSLSAASAPT